MNLDYEKQLEVLVDRKLKALPEIPAPATLPSRVIAAIAKPLVLAWYRQPWPLWPLALRALSLMTLLALFSAISFGTWQLSHAGSGMVTQRFGGQLSLLGAVWDVLSALLGAVPLILKQLSPIVLVGYFAALTFGCFMCLGIGTLGMRLALARR